MMNRSRLSKGRRLRLVLFPCPYQGHITPMLQLASLLHSRGFSITIVHPLFNSPNPSNYPHFQFEPIFDGILDQSAARIQSSSDITSFLTTLNLNCLVPFRDCLLRLLSTPPHDDDDELEEPIVNGANKIACIISDATMYFTQAVAESLQLPRIVLRTSGITSFVSFLSFPLLLQKGYLPIKESEMEKLVTELPPLKVKDIPNVKTKDQSTLYEFVVQMVDKAKCSSGLIWNSFEYLERSALDIIQRDFQIPMFPIGPFHRWPLFTDDSSSSCSSQLSEDHSCLSWLDKQAPKSVIYVSFGSLASMDDEKELVEIALALANSGHPFLWVLRPGLVSGGVGNSGTVEVGHLLPEEWFEDTISSNGSGRGFIVKWAPQERVLAHPAVGGFWTHSGWNSTIEAIAQGVPMLCRPCFGDQMVNARYVCEVWRIGFQLENGKPLEKKEVEIAIRKLMTYRDDDDEMAMRLQHFKEKADFCLREEGGSSFQSMENLISLILSF